MDARRKLGNKGEELAAHFLEDLGYKVIDRQYRTRFGEIDLVARDGHELVFVEVKTRTNLAFGHPEEAVHSQKLSRMVRAGEMYLEKHRLESYSYRYDVIAITWVDGEVPEVVHLKAV